MQSLLIKPVDPNLWIRSGYDQAGSQNSGSGASLRFLTIPRVWWYSVFSSPRPVHHQQPGNLATAGSDVGGVNQLDRRRTDHFHFMSPDTLRRMSKVINSLATRIQSPKYHVFESPLWAHCRLLPLSINRSASIAAAEIIHRVAEKKLSHRIIVCCKATNAISLRFTNCDSTIRYDYDCGCMLKFIHSNLPDVGFGGDRYKSRSLRR